MGNYISVAGLIVGVFGVVVGALGTAVAFREKILKGVLDRTLKKIEEERVGEIWTRIGINCTAFDALDEARKLVQSRQTVDHEVLGKIESARRATVDLYRLLLKEAVSIERDFSIATIEKWKKTGRLENAWRIKAAMRLLPTDKVPDCDSSESEFRT